MFILFSFLWSLFDLHTFYISLWKLQIALVTDLPDHISFIHQSIPSANIPPATPGVLQRIPTRPARVCTNLNSPGRRAFAQNSVPYLNCIDKPIWWFCWWFLAVLFKLSTVCTEIVSGRSCEFMSKLSVMLKIKMHIAIFWTGCKILITLLKSTVVEYYYFGRQKMCKIKMEPFLKQ